MKSLPFIFSIMALLILPLASSEVKFNVEEKDLGSVVFLELNNPAIFNLTINNLGEGDNGEIYTLVGVSMAPKGTFQIPTGKSTLEIMAYPGEYFKKREGIYSFEYNIRAFNQGIYTDKLTITVVSLKDSLEISCTFGTAKVIARSGNNLINGVIIPLSFLIIIGNCISFSFSISLC